VFLNMDAALHVLGGPHWGETISVPQKLLIGRGHECDLRLGSEFVSARHCALFVDDQALRIRDLGSKNGTFVSGRRIGTNATVLSHGDTITIGDVSVLVDLMPAAQGTGCFEGDTVQADAPAASPPRSPGAAPIFLPPRSSDLSPLSDPIGPVPHQEHAGG
jgi:predicted component of type VI protein secretion system